MLHLTTEIGKPGKRERERRHFPDLENLRGVTKYVPRGRRYLPHNTDLSGDGEWTPHNQSLNIEYTKCGPDWDSRLRYIPPPKSSDYPAAEIWPNNWKSMRPYPFTYRRSDTEWLLDPDHHRIGLRCYFNGNHQATMTSSRELTHSMLLGKNRKEDRIQRRNTIPEAAPGDKIYQAVEYSPGFHAAGSTRPIVQFGNPSSANKPDTFIPLQSLPPIECESFRSKERNNILREEINCVEKLDSWKPATPLHLTLPQEEPKKH
ncbi:spermatogenesis-associated serine-rich protein 1 [Patella vulgata]|uniref:spermatogenesis-associated serine-rich protein 1 n=1 Tax=Patella vulgata TaxID=6465 RepID=UPI002180090A|nr:spermatogenesis-associated serine-rich protein 1 [Patella vulgata]